MSPELITIIIAMISVGAAIVGALLAGIWVLLNRMDNAIDKLKIELKADIADSETRLRQEIADSEARQKEEIASIRNDIAASETRLRQEIADSETRRKEDTASIRNDIASIRNEIAASETRRKEDTASIREDIKELRSSVINLGQRVARVEALLIKDFATELAIDPTQLASEPEYRAGVSEPKPDGAT